MNCPHCGSTLLWSDDRGAHCDGCDKYEPPAPSAATSNRDWMEDFSHENGQYRNKCCICHNEFIGHKRRVHCKLCDAAPSAATVTPRTDAYRRRIVELDEHPYWEDFARQLKRDLAAKTAELEAARTFIAEQNQPLAACLQFLGLFGLDASTTIEQAHTKATQVLADLAATRQRCERLEKALREIADCPGKCCATCQTKARVALAKQEKPR